jgi:Protein of unknown function (DUF664).
MTDPTIDAAHDLLADSLATMRAVVAGADPAALDWRPGGEDTNSIAVLAIHSMHSTRSWLSVATGAPLPERDRPSEFLATADDVDELLAFFDAMSNECRALLHDVEAWDPGELLEAHRATRDDQEPVSAAWALIHALQHLREHVAHTQLTRQLWDRQPGRS